MAVPPSKTMFSYFTKLPSKTSIIEEENTRKLAPVYNRQHVEEFQGRLEQFDAELSADVTSENYLSSIKSGKHKAFRLEGGVKGPLRARLLQFHEDVRPPYFGTWQKHSKLVTGRRPYVKDDEVFDYEVDSEAEWDIGGPGESLKGDDSEDDEDGLDDYEIDMKTFVPHGYVSDDEVDVNSDNEVNPSADRSIDDDCDGDNSNSSIKLDSEKRTKCQQVADHQQQQFTPQPPKQTPKLDIKPITLGLNFEDNPQISETKSQFLNAYRGVSCG